MRTHAIYRMPWSWGCHDLDDKGICGVFSQRSDRSISCLDATSVDALGADPFRICFGGIATSEAASRWLKPPGPAA